MALIPGDRFDRYTIEAVLGQGGMGRVFRAHDAKLKRKIALKVLRSGGAGESTGGGKGRLIREAQAAAALDHPNVVSIFDVGEHDGEPFIAMELVEGKSLKSFVGDPRIPLARRIGWLRDIASALACAHDRGLVHRDVRPSNVMIRNDGVVKVFDFGIARVTDRKGPRSSSKEGAKGDTQTLTGKDVLVGTPRYMSPEQLRSETVDGRADQFAWGVVAYELVTGRLPWDNMEEDVDLVASILLQPILAPSSHEPELPPAVDDIIVRALSRTASDRFESMSLIAAALDAYATGSSRDVTEEANAADLLARDVIARTGSGTPAPRSAARTAPPDDDAETQGTKSAHALPKVEIAPPPARSRTSTVVTGLLGVGLVSLVGVALVKKWPGADVSVPTVPSSIVSSAPSGRASNAPTPLTDLPLAVSDVPAAAAAYAAGMQALRDGAHRLAVASFAKAVALDKQMAAAHMRMGMYTFYESPTDARSHLSLAQQRRYTLSPRDQVLLDALDPYIRSQPADHDEYQKRLRAAIDRFPGDAELVTLLAYERAGSEMDDAASLAGYDRALVLDPSYGMAYAYKGQEQAYRNDLAGTLATSDACRKAVPNAGFCIHLRVGVEELTGRCADMQVTARNAIALEPTLDTGYRALAKSLAAQEQPLDVVRATLEQAWARLGESGPTFDSKEDLVNLLALGGQFDEAEKVARGVLTAVGPEAAAGRHARPAQLLVDIYRETGREKLAAEIADGYLRHRAAWMPDPRGEDFAVGRDPAPQMLAMLRATGKISAEAYATQRTQWVTTWKGALLPRYVRYAWIHGYAIPASLLGTAEEAKAALDAQPPFGEIPTFIPRTLAVADVGRTFLLAGREKEARTWLENAAKSCDVLEMPFAHTRALYDLGTVLEKAGDKAGACRAYGVVVQRWGRATPKSVTASKARDHQKGLKCQ